LQGVQIDVLINNAGLLQDEVLGSIDVDSLRIQMEINAYAPLRIAEALFRQMPSGGKIANITSRMGSLLITTPAVATVTVPLKPH